jgi:hypothetical protein
MALDVHTIPALAAHLDSANHFAILIGELVWRASKDSMPAEHSELAITHGHSEANLNGILVFRCSADQNRHCSIVGQALFAVSHKIQTRLFSVGD